MNIIQHSDEIGLQVEPTGEHGFCMNCDCHSPMYEVYMYQEHLDNDVYALCASCVWRLRKHKYLRCVR